MSQLEEVRVDLASLSYDDLLAFAARRTVEYFELESLVEAAIEDIDDEIRDVREIKNLHLLPNIEKLKRFVGYGDLDED